MSALVAPTEDIKTLIDGESDLGLTYATDLFIGEMPDTPDRCVCLFDTGGWDPHPDPDLELTNPTVMAHVRGTRGHYLETQYLAQDIRDLVRAAHNVTVGSTRLIGVRVTGDVNWLGYDGQHRPLFSINFRIHRTAV